MAFRPALIPRNSGLASSSLARKKSVKRSRARIFVKACRLHHLGVCVGVHACIKVTLFLLLHSEKVPCSCAIAWPLDTYRQIRPQLDVKLFRLGGETCGGWCRWWWWCSGGWMVRVITLEEGTPWRISILLLSLLFIPLAQSYRSFPGPQTSLADILSLSILKSDKANYFMNEPITIRLRCILLFDYLYINY